jgi:hypothetical protein
MAQSQVILGIFLLKFLDASFIKHAFESTLIVQNIEHRHVHNHRNTGSSFELPLKFVA